jgi:hypothetical protein
LTGPGAVVAGTAAGIAAEETYKASGADKQFDDFIDNSVTPLVQSGIEKGLDAIDSAVEIGLKAVDDVQEMANEYYNDLFVDNNESVQQ